MIKIKYCDKLIVECDTASEAAQLINKNIRGKDGFDKIVKPRDLGKDSYFIRLTGRTPYKLISAESTNHCRLEQSVTSDSANRLHIFGVSLHNGNISHVGMDEFVFELTAEEALKYED